MFFLTGHATVRAQQRGISLAAIHLITAEADRRVRVAGGGHALSISERAREVLVTGGVPPADIDRTRGIVVISDLRTGDIITVEHIHGHRRRIRR